MLICPKCQVKNFNTNKICKECGFSLDNEKLRHLQSLPKRIQPLSVEERHSPRETPKANNTRPNYSAWNFSDSTVGKKEEDRVFEESSRISITKNTISYGGSVYQFKNVTGFGSGRIPKDPLPMKLLLTLCGVFLIFFLGVLIHPASILVSIFLGAIIFIIIYDNLSKTDSYGLVLYLNSGQERIFVCKNERFLQEIIIQIYKFMEEGDAEPIYIDLSQRYINDRCITVEGNFSGAAVSGDQNTVNS